MNKVPVLLLTFNRPDHTMKVLEVVKKYKPTKIFIASDGYRTNVKGEKEKVLELRKKMLQFVDWDCDLKIRYSESNLGCKIGVSSAISWFFDHVDEGVILEDDIIINQEFFEFCKQMLYAYKDNDKVLSISGYNPLPYLISNDTFYFSKYFFSWGWATWSHKWNKIDLNLEEYRKKKPKQLKQMYPLVFEKKIRLKKINDAINGKKNSWAIPWNFTHQLNNSFSIIPKENQIKNIGFSNEFSTHTKENAIDKIFMDLSVKKIRTPIRSPKEIKENKLLTYYFLVKEFIRILLKKLCSPFIN